MLSIRDLLEGGLEFGVSLDQALSRAILALLDLNLLWALGAGGILVLAFSSLRIALSLLKRLEPEVPTKPHTLSNWVPLIETIIALVIVVLFFLALGMLTDATPIFVR